MLWKWKGRKNGEEAEESTPAEPALWNSETDLVWLRRMLAHNVRMPMSVITGYGEMLRKGLLHEEEKEECIHSICENIVYMNNILSVIFGDGKEADMVGASRTAIVDVVRRMAAYVGGIARKTHVAILVEAENEELYVEAQEIPIMRIFYQLFENAFKYLGEGNMIRIHIYSVGAEQVLIVFKDDGPGMTEAEAGRLFTPGYRGSNAAGKPGSGMGLYDVKRVTEAYGGTVEAKSASGKGFSVLLMLPAAQG